MNDPLGLFDEGKGQDPLGLFSDTPKTSWKEDIATSFAGVVNTADRALSGLALAGADLFGQDKEAENIYKNLQDRVKQREQWANPEKKEQSFGGKVLGTVATLPMQVASFPFSPFETGQTMLEQGETLPRAVAGTGMDTAGNIAGMALPGALGKTIAGKAISGGAINAAQDTAVRSGIAGIAEQQSTKDLLGPSMESAGLSAIVGAGMGAVSPSARRNTIKPSDDTPAFKSIIAAEKEAQTPVVRDPVQMELPPDGFIQAPQYGVMEGMSRIDENGMPIKADVSMEAQNLESPMQMGLWGDELGPGQGAERSYTEALDAMSPAERAIAVYQRDLHSDMKATPELEGAIEKANTALDPREGPFSLPSKGANQRGGIDVQGIIDTITGERRKPSLIKPIEPDNINTPRSAENIAARQTERSKAAAISLKNSPYENIATIEEAKANPGKDIMNNPVRDKLTPGISSMVRHSAGNNILKFMRDAFQSGRNLEEEFSKKYVTGNDGLASALQKASDNEKIKAFQIVQELKTQKVDLTPELMVKLGLSENEARLINSFRTLTEGMLDLSNDSYMTQGFNPIKPDSGYAPNNFSGTYTTILRQPGNKGRVLVAQGDTKLAMNKAIEYYKKNFREHTQVIEIPRRGLKDTAMRSNRVFNGFNSLVQAIAETNPDFADAKAKADTFAALNIKEMYNFDVHEKRKTGARGSLGDRPWLDIKENSNQFWDGVINWAEEGARYYAYQDPLNKAAKLQTDPDLIKTHENTLKYIEKYSRHVRGNSLNTLGAAGNAAIDLAPKLFGYSSTGKVTGALRTLSSMHMMGLLNVGFFALQLTQVFTGGVPEALKIQKNLGTGSLDMAKSVSNMTSSVGALWMEPIFNKKAEFVPQHMRNAWHWAQQHGMFDFSEAVLARDATKPTWQRYGEKAATVPMWLGEQMTRPPIFMLYTDMFHRAGFPEEQAFRKAQEATDYAMANYHPDERAQIYSDLGVMGQFMGALSTYKHNLLDQFYTRGADMKKGELAPAAAMMAMAYIFYGISGLPGYEEADSMVRWLTNKSIREHGEKILSEPTLWDGAISVHSGIDIASRMSMASIIPEDDPLSVVPHIANTVKIIGSGIDYAKAQDTTSRNNFLYQATPSGMRGMTEKALRNRDGYVLDKDNQNRYDVPRTKKEWDIRTTTGLRPLSERVTDERTFGQNKSFMNTQKKQKELVDVIERSILAQDQEGVQRAYNEYLALGGDPTIFTTAWLQKLGVSANISQKQRLEGIPTQTIKSQERYKAFNP